MVTAAEEVCSAWADIEDVGAPCTTYGFDEDLLADALLIASGVLFNLTGRRWPGQCVDKIWPTAHYRPGRRVPHWWPATDGFESRFPFGLCSCNRSEDFGCAQVPEILLPRRPVIASTIEVKIDGQSFTSFRLDDKHKLRRTDGGAWRCCQNLLLDDDAVGTWSIQYGYGLGPPRGGVRAAALLGCQLALAYDPSQGPDGACKLPKRVQTITRAGTTIAFVDPYQLFKDGLTGLAAVDLWVSATNRGAQARRGRMLGGNLRRGFTRRGAPPGP